MNYIIQQTDSFDVWMSTVKDLRAKVAIARRIEQAQAGNLGDVKPVRDGVSEMRIDVGAGYRVYYTARERVIVILLIGGNKSTQSTDIKKAIAMAREI
jgi:putative addiction module killer protein